MTTKTVSNRDLVNTSAMVFIRPLDVTLNISDVRPNSRLYVFFDGQPVNRYFTPAGGSKGGILMSNGAGRASGVLSIPSNTFQTGAREIKVQDNPVYGYFKVAGTSASSATATFYTSGVQNTFQESITRIEEQVVNIEDTTWVDVEIPPPVINIPVPVIQEIFVPTAPLPPIEIPVPQIVFPGAALDTIPPTNPAPVPDVTEGIPAPNNIISGLLESLRLANENRNALFGDRVDPLAQSFFTFGIKDGCFLTKIDLFFQSKDSTLPVFLELREIEAGFPSLKHISGKSRVSLNASEVNISDNASVPTSFVFPRPIYLKQDSDYCFVLLSNSKEYQLWTSRFGEVSNETGNTIFEQPYAGSLFKSENNLTWTAEQYEDIKFTMYKAKFDTTVETNLIFAADPGKVEIKGTQLYSIAGSNKIRYYARNQHCLEVDSKIVVESQPQGVLNGINSHELSGSFTVVSVLDEYTLDFAIGVNAPSTGFLTTPGYVTAVYLDAPGTGYTTAPTVTFSGGGATTPATATAEVFDGRVFRINLTSRGEGYTSAPTVVISGSGTGASVVATIDSQFFISTNRPAHIVKPVISNFKPDNTFIQSTLKMTTGNYFGGNLNSYSLRDEEEVTLNQSHELNTNSWIVSRQNEFSRMNNASSTVLEVLMASANPNVSPVIDYLVNSPSLHTTAFSINNQDGEDTFENSLIATPTASIQKFSVTSGGAGYVSGANRPTVFVTGGGGSGAIGLARVGGLRGIEITDGGSGYTTAPEVIITGTGTNASAAALIKDGAVVSLIPFDSGDDYTSATISFTGGGGTGAAANAIIASPSEITQVRLIDTGTGYTSTPEVTIVDPRVMTPGTGAAVAPILSTFNTERKPSGGTARAKYVSKIFKLGTPSTGSRLYSTIYSPATGGVDVYIRTSLSSSGVDHKSLTWKQMKGNAERNLSGKKGEFLDYTFLFDNLQEYDTFDLKIVLRASVPSDPPQVRNFRFIATT